MIKVLVSDALGDAGIQILEATDGVTVDVKTGLSPDALQEIIGDYDALVIRSATKVTDALLAAGKKLKVVGRAGIGLDNVDIPAATRRGVVALYIVSAALSRGMPRGDDIRVVSGIVFVIKNGLRWRDAPRQLRTSIKTS